MSDFFHIDSKEINGEQWKVQLTLNHDHPVYKGHFPEKPVAPGVMLTQMIREILEDELGRELTMKKARNIKFLNMVLPENVTTMEVDLTVKQVEEVEVNAAASANGSIYFKISAAFV